MEKSYPRIGRKGGYDLRDSLEEIIALFVVIRGDGKILSFNRVVRCLQEQSIEI